MPAKTQRIVIIGGGFAGLAVARALRHSDATVTLVDRHNYHVFQPLLYQVATGSVSPENITTPLRDVLGRHSRVEVLMGEVDGLSPAHRLVWLGKQALPYDQLVVAAGTATSYFGNPQWSAHAHGLKTLDDALLVRRQVLWALEKAEHCRDPQRRASYLTFVVVGGGPTGVEMAGALANLLSDLGRARYRHIDPRRATILLVESSGRVLSTYAPRLSASAGEKLTGLQISLSLASRVTDVRPDGVTVTTDGVARRIDSHTVIWAAGMQASAIGQLVARQTGAAATRNGRLKLLPDMSLPNHPEIFVVGDLAAIAGPDGKILPAVAPVATQAGDFVGRQLARRLRGDISQVPFVYRDLGSMAVIGRGSAVVHTKLLNLTGGIAWLAWLVVHLGALHGKANKLFVGLQWLMSFVIKRPSARSIFGRSPPTLPAAAAAAPQHP